MNAGAIALRGGKLFPCLASCPLYLQFSRRRKLEGLEQSGGIGALAEALFGCLGWWGCPVGRPGHGAAGSPIFPERKYFQFVRCLLAMMSPSVCRQKWRNMSRECSSSSSRSSWELNSQTPTWTRRQAKLPSATEYCRPIGGSPSSLVRSK
jgi:hypothetical protein